ncbi:peptidylprolyl isomerase, partial [Escherichia coli]|uniref:peptidylprolyl isomerase n=1 Tax=Escherichia coli TaxID=562 RepID=UPI003EE0DB66
MLADAQHECAVAVYGDDVRVDARRAVFTYQTKTEDEAKAVLDELNKGGDFAALAKEKSADIISARNGGDMG